MMLLPDVLKKLEFIDFPNKHVAMNKLKVVISILKKQEQTELFIKPPKPKFVIRSPKESVKPKDEKNKETLNKPVKSR